MLENTVGFEIRLLELNCLNITAHVTKLLSTRLAAWFLRNQGNILASDNVPELRMLTQTDFNQTNVHLSIRRI